MPISKASECSKPVIGLTGGIGAGKSTVADVLRELGCFVVNSDELGRQALRDAHIRDQLVEWWGTEILDANGDVDRSRVAHIVFNQPAERKRLEALTHPWIESRRRELFTAAPPDTAAMVIDAPLLLEAGLDQECDAVLFVDASHEVRLRRVQESRGWDEAELDRRELSQLSLDVKRERADHTVVNNGDRKTLRQAVRRILGTILAQ